METLGVLVFGYRRRMALWNVLESLRRQDALGCTHVWIDGLAHSGEWEPQVREVRALREEFVTASWTNINGRLGIEKLMLDGLTDMARRYERIVVLEDDCFPTADAIEVFRESLDRIAADPRIYSVYGSPFGVEGEGDIFARFQGWGWATTRDKLVPVLAQLKSMFSMSEPEYLAWTATCLTPEMRSRLDVTPGRNVVHVLERQFSWDSGTALLTGLHGQQHCRAPKRIVYNCGAGSDAGHFREEVDRYRDPPFNMIGADETWQYFHEPPPAAYRGRKSFGLDDLDVKLEAYLPDRPGTFVELGAFDGLAQTNTLRLERRGWRGLLIEPVPEGARKCRLYRPLARVVQAACVDSGYVGDDVEIDSVGLMSLVAGARGSGQDAWIARGERVQGLDRERLRVPARTLAAILTDEGMDHIDLLSLDVEGYEQQVLDGLGLGRISPTFILVEDSHAGELEAWIASRGYELVAVLNQREFTRDLLFHRRATVAGERPDGD